MNYLDSRYIGLFDVPDPKEINVRFVYNFFVPDERTNRAGMPRFQGVTTEKTQREIKDKTLETLLPRFVEIKFTQTNAGNSNIQDFADQKVVSENKNLIQSEETITTPNDVIMKYSDPSLVPRLTQKAEALASILAISDNTTIEKVEKITHLNDTLDTQSLEEILCINNSEGVQLVNEVGDLSTPPIFSQAAMSDITGILDRRVMKSFFGGNYTHSGFTKSQLYKKATNDALKYLPVASDDSGKNSDEPFLVTLTAQPVAASSDEVRSLTVGYVIERSEVKFDGSEGPDVKYYIDGEDSTTFLDTKMVYGSTYKYSVRTVALVEMTIESNGDENLSPGFYRILALISSNASPPKIVEAIETISPLPPDGVFYRFNYDHGRGLFIRWQIPTGKQRDVKYFQIFRRKSIHEPFMCVAEIDFDDSTIRTSRQERVNPDRVIRMTGSTTVYLDSEFNRGSSYIYAVVALDAHGLTSGYSAQSQVSFDRIMNKIKLKNISKSGAPKQYPNFFIDPDLDDNVFVDSLTQDAMKSSKKFKINIYFDPDTVEYTSQDGTKLPLLATDNSQGVYKLQLLNIDRQKAQILELKIDDLR